MRAKRGNSNTYREIKETVCVPKFTFLLPLLPLSRILHLYDEIPPMGKNAFSCK